MEGFKVYLVSDSLKLQAVESVARLAALQFSDVSCDFVQNTNVTTEQKAREVVEQASLNKPSLVVFATTLIEVKNTIIKECLLHRVENIDVLSPLVKTFGNILKIPPVYKQDQPFELGQDYYDKISAIEFAIKNDDGQRYHDLKKADVVLLGVSRTSKTPLSIYLAYHNLYVVNIPVVENMKVPKELFEISPRKIIGLTIGSERLNEIRSSRDTTMGVIGISKGYAGMNNIVSELEFAADLMKRVGCKIINVSDKAIEETAEIIMEQLKRGRKKKK